MKIRNERRDYRERIKARANQDNSLKFEHPQARREMQHHDDEITEALTDEEDTDYSASFISPISVRRIRVRVRSVRNGEFFTPTEDV